MPTLFGSKRYQFAHGPRPVLLHRGPFPSYGGIDSCPGDLGVIAPFLIGLSGEFPIMGGLVYRKTGSGARALNKSVFMWNLFAI